MNAPKMRRALGPRTLAVTTLLLVCCAVLLYGLSPAPPSTAGAILRFALLAVLCATAVGHLVSANRELTRTEAQGRRVAALDPVTATLTRSALFATLDQRRATGGPEAGATALAIIDCDDFAQVNDTWGHLAGDDLLREVATRLTDAFGSEALIARQSGDQFILAMQLTDISTLDDLKGRVCSVFDDPFTVGNGRLHHQTASIGLTFADARLSTTPLDLLREADIALRSAKSDGRGQAAVFDDALRRLSQKRATVSDALEDAIRRGMVRPAFQPILGGPSYDKIVGWEALARWHDPFLGDVSPADFIPLAEEHGLIGELGEHMLRASCLHLAELRDALGVPGVWVSVNVSAPQLQEPTFVKSVLSAVEAARLEPHNLVLEITESLLVDDSVALDTLRELREHGIHISLDDFGTGYASIATLLRMPVDCVKLDRSLVSRLGSYAEATDQVRAIIQLVGTLAIDRVVAEGVETRDEADILLQIGCPMVQGWLFGRPTPPAEILDHPTRPRGATRAPHRQQTTTA